jgi:anti-anti-sigma regulatory factor
LLVDLRGIAVFDRPGLGALVGVLRGAHPGVGRVRVCADQPALVRLLRAEGLDRLFPLVTRPDQPAVAARP